MVKKILLLLLIFFSFFTSPTYSQSAEELEKVISELSQKLAELNKQKNTLSNQIKIFDTQIAQTELKIKQTTSTIGILKNEIADLSVKIGDLDVSLNNLSAVYIQQVAQNYKLEKRLPFMGLLNFTSLNNFLQNYKYISVLQQNSQNTLVEMETNRTNMDLQKQAKAEKQTELEAQQKKLSAQQKNLADQKISKDNLLKSVKNDETKYQTLLKQAKAEYEAIQNILVGNGSEVYVSEVKAGDKIASVILGASCNSSGSHLHYMIKNNKTPVNPFTKLKAGVDYVDNSGGDPFNPSGSWEWPLKGKISFNQGYGVTSAISNNTWVRQIYSFHTGIDIFSSSSYDVFSTHDGKLYRGRYGGTCSLRYVRVEDKSDASLSTLYLHVNY